MKCLLFWGTIIIVLTGMVIYMLPSILFRCFRRKRRTGFVECLYKFFCVDDEGAFFVNLAAVVFALFLVISFIELAFIVWGDMGREAKRQERKMQYEELKLKIENREYREMTNVSEKQLIKEVHDWNEDILFLKYSQRDFWIGIFIPNIYDEFQTIDYVDFITGDKEKNHGKKEC